MLVFTYGSLVCPMVSPGGSWWGLLGDQPGIFIGAHVASAELLDLKEHWLHFKVPLDI